MEYQQQQEGVDVTEYASPALTRQGATVGSDLLKGAISGCQPTGLMEVDLLDDTIVSNAVGAQNLHRPQVRSAVQTAQNSQMLQTPSGYGNNGNQQAAVPPPQAIVPPLPMNTMTPEEHRKKFENVPPLPKRTREEMMDVDVSKIRSPFVSASSMQQQPQQPPSPSSNSVDASIADMSVVYPSSEAQQQQSTGAQEYTAEEWEDILTPTLQTFENLSSVMKVVYPIHGTNHRVRITAIKWTLEASDGKKYDPKFYADTAVKTSAVPSRIKGFYAPTASKSGAGSGGATGNSKQLFHRSSNK